LERLAASKMWLLGAKISNWNQFNKKCGSLAPKFRTGTNSIKMWLFGAKISNWNQFNQIALAGGVVIIAVVPLQCMELVSMSKSGEL
jgi:hypothetical protein